jgi:hypothetical protein
MWDKGRIVRLAMVVILMEGHIAVLKWASGCMICKPGKDDYAKLKAYRSKSLLSCIGKLVQKVVAELLSEVANGMGPRSDGQFDSGKEWSTIDAAAIMVDTGHAAWTHGNITGVLLRDIKAPFPCKAEGRLLHLLNVRQKDGDHIRWTESCLAE